ncbi:thermonuclease family protein, partial [Thiolapillus sp.]
MKFKNIVPTLLLIVSTTASAATLEGKAIRVIDGDTIVVLSEAHQKYRVRLANIDCPEKRQPWGNKAKRATSKLVGNKPVVVEWQKLDRYSRLI